MNRYLFLFVAGCIVLCGCSSNKHKAVADSVHIYPTISYLDIKLDSTGRLPTNPYIKVYKNGDKQIVFCGTNHPAHGDTLNPMFATIQNKYFEVRPDVCINEGGDVSKKHYASIKDAIAKNGEIGLIKALADSLKISCINGDMTDSLEFKELLKYYTKGEFWHT